MKLKLAKFANLAEIVGAFAVVASLSKETEFQFMMQMHGIFLGFQSSYLMSEEGTVDPELVDGLTAAILAIKDTPGMKRYWRQRRTLLHPRYARYVDELLRREGERETPMEIYRVTETDQPVE